MNKDDLRSYVRTILGGPDVGIELVNNDIDTATDRTLEKFNQFLTLPDPRISKNQAGSVRIPLLEGDRGVLLVETLFPEDTRTYAQMSIFELMYRMVFPRFPISDWYLLKSFYESYQRVRGTDPDWFFDEVDRVLWVDCASGPYDVFYLIATDLTLDNIDTHKVGYISDFKEYVTALCKLILGRRRGKFGDSIPVPGGTLSTDASELRAEGQATIIEIEEKLENKAKYTTSPIIWG